MEKLNLGCGEFPKEGYVNVDFYSVSDPDIKHDLNKFPYPFSDDQFSLVSADHVLEHLDRPFDVMREIHRISAPGAQVEIRVPHCSRGFTHAQHAHGFDVSFPYYFNSQYKLGCQDAEFRLVGMTFKWFAQPYLKRRFLSPAAFWLARLVGGVVNAVANLGPFVCSRIWCYWVGGFEEIEFVFQTVKDSPFETDERR